MVAGHLQEKDGNFYMVLSYKDSSGKRKTKWFATGLPVKGNKKRAEAMLAEKRKTFDPAVSEQCLWKAAGEQWTAGHPLS